MTDGTLDAAMKEVDSRAKIRLAVSEAREAKVCRICGGSTEVPRSGTSWLLEPVVYNFGKEHAHGRCVEAKESERRNRWRFEMEA